VEEENENQEIISERIKEKTQILLKEYNESK